MVRPARFERATFSSGGQNGEEGGQNGEEPSKPGYLVVLGNSDAASCSEEKRGDTGAVVAGNYLGAITISHQVGCAGVQQPRGSPHCRTDSMATAGCARGIAVGSDNRPWILGCQTRPDGNRSVLHYNGAPGGGWTEVGGWGIEIAVDPSNNLPLVLTKDGSIYYYTGK